MLVNWNNVKKEDVEHLQNSPQSETRCLWLVPIDPEFFFLQLTPIYPFTPQNCMHTLCLKAKLYRQNASHNPFCMYNKFKTNTNGV